MTPEELEATREEANVDYAPDIAYEDWQAMARALLAHIDSQAVTINNLAAALDEAKVDQVNFSSACQEELANARALLPVPIGSGQTIKASGDAAVRRRKVVEMFPELIAHIDAQAAEIEILKMGEKAADRLILQGRQCEEQIEALKDALVEERAQVLAGKGNLLWDPLPKEDRPDGLYPAKIVRGKTYWRNLARKQLAHEMPEAFQ